MGFRRDSDKAMHWNKWLKCHLAELIECGLPDFLFADEDRWNHFVGHGYDHESGWKREMLPPYQFQRLRAFMAREYGTNTLPAELRPIEKSS